MQDALCFFFNDAETTEIYTLSLHDALPIVRGVVYPERRASARRHHAAQERALGSAMLLPPAVGPLMPETDRKSTRLNSSHANISYAVFCLKKNLHILHITHDQLTNRDLFDT